MVCVLVFGKLGGVDKTASLNQVPKFSCSNIQVNSTNVEANTRTCEYYVGRELNVPGQDSFRGPILLQLSIEVLSYHFLTTHLRHL
jgi:hypothetical protein